MALTKVNAEMLSATGTKDATTFLRGDNTFAVVAVTPTAVSSQANTATDYFSLPSGTTAERPGSPVNGMIRYNTTLNKVEAYQNGEWIFYALAYTIDYLIVAGGASGSRVPNTNGGGGGGAGGLLSSTYPMISGNAFSIVVGGGGAAYQSPLDGGGNAGSNTTGLSLTAIGGGTGGWYNATEGYQNARSGGSGGGATWNGSNDTTFGAGTAGQGNNGGVGSPDGTSCGGGGGGSAAVGGNAPNNSLGGTGGAGTNWQSLGTFYAGGGGGGSAGTARASGGTGGGGAGGFQGTSAEISGIAGSVNTGGGGGGTSGTGYGTTGTKPSGAGGSGIVIIRYAGSQKGTGGTVTSAGGYTYHTFTTSSTYNS